MLIGLPCVTEFQLDDSSDFIVMGCKLFIINDYYFIVSDAAANVEGSQIGLLSGDKVKLSDLLFMLMLIQISGKSFPRKYTTAVSFIPENVVDGAFTPFCTARLGRTFNVRQ